MKSQPINHYSSFQDNLNHLRMSISFAPACERREDFKYCTNQAQRYKQ
jgi:hypothetical protein